MLGVLNPSRLLGGAAKKHMVMLSGHGGFGVQRRQLWDVASRSLGAMKTTRSEFAKPLLNNAARWGANVRGSIRNLVSKREMSSASASVVLEQPPPVVSYWLYACAGTVFGAVVLGGITRLTESGLSMTKWHPIKGMVPPLSEEEWIAEFEHYKQFPEYQELNKGMTVDEFKKIFFWEYSHRMWGRLVGLAFVVPAVYFGARGYLPGKKLKLKLFGIACMIGFQGLLGWYMVRSGMDKETLLSQESSVPRVSQYRLAAHLGSAFLIYISMFLLASNLRKAPASVGVTPIPKKMQTFAVLFSKWIFFTAMSGALVAGLDAGLTYNTFPMMADRWIPDDLWALEPKWRNCLDNPTTVQFDHRYMGLTTVAAITALWAYGMRQPLSPRARLALNCTLGVAYVQMCLGISTLLYFVPVELAASHQAGSLTLLTCAMWLANELKRLPKL
eukprot:Nk52_evm73s62 gene=Nk52_evmTU73s62